MLRWKIKDLLVRPEVFFTFDEDLLHRHAQCLVAEHLAEMSQNADRETCLGRDAPTMPDKEPVRGCEMAHTSGSAF